MSDVAPDPDVSPRDPDGDRPDDAARAADRAAVRRLRRPTARTAGAAAAVLAALATGHVISSAFPADERVQAPFYRPGTVGEPVELRYARVTAGEPDGSTVLDTDDGTLLTTPGVWVTVPLTIVTKGEPRAVNFAEVVGGDGRTYAVLTGGRSAFLPGTAQPGVPRYATVRVELPPEAVPGARLRIALNPLDTRRDDMAEIDLGLTRADADTWSALDTPVVARSSSDEPPEDS